jgi:hypothetical protein
MGIAMTMCRVAWTMIEMASYRCTQHLRIMGGTGDGDRSRVSWSEGAVGEEGEFSS